VFKRKINLEMGNEYQNEELYFIAKKKVADIKGFYGNLASFVVVNSVLLVINIVTSPQYLWFFWPLLGWGIGVVSHGLRVFGFISFFGKDWEERKIKQLIAKEEQSKKTWK
jgi:hypothetical protein